MPTTSHPTATRVANPSCSPRDPRRSKLTCSEVGKCGGTLCTGYYCTPSPTDVPPDYQDPPRPRTTRDRCVQQ
ncbi:uncharacterized protein BCR38DRAFT_437180 [Pseudomassariella vexata]|uniref:Uncharacterized protein n=1 Tax=Pseudomassariella vexata TaxID=1141098 RepID=A0A1Y2DWJ6_9PEZI|nr:uncharacterized protein BCR38DRAFT_437180 [Pseudomassariella vexata]ORY63569.1 hypothetical protein BCR38DRAFT_437180 [Pseudomassariella vexata]